MIQGFRNTLTIAELMETGDKYTFSLGVYVLKSVKCRNLNI